MHMYLFGVLCIVTWSLYCYNLNDSAPKIHLVHTFPDTSICTGSSVVVLLNNLNLSFSVIFLFLFFFSHYWNAQHKNLHWSLKLEILSHEKLQTTFAFIPFLLFMNPLCQMLAPYYGCWIFSVIRFELQVLIFESLLIFVDSLAVKGKVDLFLFYSAFFNLSNFFCAIFSIDEIFQKMKKKMILTQVLMFDF